MTATVVPIVLNLKNYDDWSSRIKTYLLAENLWNVVEGSYRPIREDGEFDDEAWEKKDAKALYAIQNSCGDDIYQFIKNETMAKGAWDTLSNKLKKPDEKSDEKVYMSVGEAYPTLTKPEVSMEEGRTQGHDESNAEDISETFVKYVKSNDWDNVIKFLRQHRELAGNAKIPFVVQDDHFENGTVLHYAILNTMSCSVRIIQQLVDLMAKEDLEIQDCYGATAFYHLVNCYAERVEVAECMLKKNPKLIRCYNTHNVVVPQLRPKGERMARYLYSLTPPQTLRVVEAAKLLTSGFYYNRFDIAWDLIQRYPELAMATDLYGSIPLVQLANNRFAFKSGSRLSLWEKLIYYGIRIKPLPTSVNVPESDHSDQMYLSNKKENQRHLISSGIGLFRRLVANLQTLLGINRIYHMKLTHERVKQLLPLMCKAASESMTSERMSSNTRKKLEATLCVAAERGHVEYITNFLGNNTNPLFGVKNKKGQSPFQIAVECRQHKVYNLIYLFDPLPNIRNTLGLDQSEKIRKRVGMTDDFGNNLLHTVACITPMSQIGHIQGAALQMQRELQWFKEVKSIANPKDCEFVNKDDMTPQKVFTENHKELGKEAEKSMKETSTSCTVVGALIVTIMFAAAFTVPGENDEKKDGPTFLTNKVFTIFIVSDAISLFSSTTSVIMFLGILTSRYSEDDFSKSLPTKMIIGLFTLFLSIATMMIVFSCGLYIMLDGKSSIVIPSILLASVPVSSFIWMQFPLLVELFISTFGRGIFDTKKKKLF